MIVSFGDKVTEALYHGGPVSRLRRIPPGVRTVAARKLDMLNAANSLTDLDLQGFHSIRVNDQWRIVFKWQGSDALDVRLADYH